MFLELGYILLTDNELTYSVNQNVIRTQSLEDNLQSFQYHQI